LALLRPSKGRLWRRSSGARRPAASEQEAIDDALTLVGNGGPRQLEDIGVYVLDHPLPDAVVRGRALILCRGLVETEALGPVLAHELGHLHSLDGALTEAVDRFCLWPPLLDEEPLNENQPRSGWIYRLALLTLRFTAGGLSQRLLAPFWAS